VLDLITLYFSVVLLLLLLLLLCKEEEEDVKKKKKKKKKKPYSNTRCSHACHVCEVIVDLFLHM